MTNGIYWLLLMAFLILVEVFTLGMTAIWLAVAALVAFLISLFYDNLIVEVVLFALISLALLYTVKPLVKKYFNPKSRKFRQK